MLKTGDRVKYVGNSTHPEYQEVTLGTVTDVYDGPYNLAWPIEVIFDNYPYVINGSHPCGYEELELVSV